MQNFLLPVSTPLLCILIYYTLFLQRVIDSPDWTGLLLGKGSSHMLPYVQGKYKVVYSFPGAEWSVREVREMWVYTAGGGGGSD